MNKRAGQRFGSYSLVRLLGQGNISEVYLAEQVEHKTQAAIKILQMKITSSDRESFLTQTRLLSQLKHPHIVNIWEAGIQKNTPFLAMTYAPHGSLYTSHPPGTRVPPEQILSYVQQIAAVLQYLHDQHLIYRDLRPQNLLLGAPNNIVLADFALALISQSSRSFNMREMMGDVTYMAPEQLQGKPGPASDQYALGIILYEWLSGTAPFQGTFTEVANQHAFTPPTPLHVKVPEIAPAIEEVVQIALSKEPQWRFASVRAFSKAFEQACQCNQPLLEARTFRVPEKPALPNKQGEHQISPISSQPAAQSSHDNALLSAPQPSPSRQPVAQSSHDNALPTPPRPLPSPLPSRQPARSRRSMASTVLLCVLALLIVASGGGLLYLAPWQHSTQTKAQTKAQSTGTAQTLSLTATAQAQIQATTVAQADTNAEATADAEANAEDAANAIAMQNLYTEATRGIPVINDPLRANDSNKWDENTSSNYERCAFIGGGYHVIEPQPGDNSGFSLYSCFPHTANNFTNFALQARMTILKGDGGGLVYLADSTHKNHCYFSLDNTGVYWHECHHINGSTTWTFDSQPTAVGNKSPQANLLTIIVRNQHIFLYVNKQYVTSMKDTSITKGEIGVAAEDDTKSTDVVFNDLQVWRF